MKLLKSRTAWTILAMFLVGGIEAVSGFIPAGWTPLVQGVLGIAALYFKASPSQDY